MRTTILVVRVGLVNEGVHYFTLFPGGAPLRLGSIYNKFAFFVYFHRSVDCIAMAESRGRKVGTLPSRTSSFAVGHPRGTRRLLEDPMSGTKNGDSSRGSSLSEKKHIKPAPVYARVSSLVNIEY